MTDQVSVVIDSAPLLVQALDLSMDVSVSYPEAGQGGVLVIEAAPVVVMAQQNFFADVEMVAIPAAIGGDVQPTAKRTDVASDTVMYRGEAAVGSSETASVWRIARITTDANGDLKEEWANGSASFAFAWADRASLGYQ
jgi:hypothetical protein